MSDVMTADHRSEPEPELLRGSLITLRRRCGKPNCRCVTGDPHETPALSVSRGGRTHTLTLRDQDVAGVAQALERYQAARDRLEATAAAGLDALAARLAARRQASRR